MNSEFKSRSIRRREICRELGINDSQLKIYESFLELETGSEDFEVSTARSIARIHELCNKGMSLQDIRYLSVFAEQYSEIVPSLGAFSELSATKQLKDTNEQLITQLQAFHERELQYKSAIDQLEHAIAGLNMQLEDNYFLNKKIEHLEYEKEKYKKALEYKEEEVNELNKQVEEKNSEINELNYENSKKLNMIERLEAELEKTEARPMSQAIKQPSHDEELEASWNSTEFSTSNL